MNLPHQATKDEPKGKSGRYRTEELLGDVMRVINETGDISNTTYRNLGHYSSTTVVRHLGGSWGSVLSKLGITPEMAQEIKQKKRLGVSGGFTDDCLHTLAPTKSRACLWCDEMFISDGPHNRICNNCKNRDLWKCDVSTFSLYISYE